MNVLLLNTLNTVGTAMTRANLSVEIDYFLKILSSSDQ